MKINKKFKPERAVGKSDDPTDVKTKVFVERERVVASDGRIAVMLPVEHEEGDAVRNLVDPYIFREARSYTDKEADFLDLKFIGEDAEGKVILKNGIELPYQLVKANTELVPPDYNSIVPDGKPKFQFAISLLQLNKVASALGTTQVVLHYYGPKIALRVLPLEPVDIEVGFISLINGDE